MKCFIMTVAALLLTAHAADARPARAIARGGAGRGVGAALNRGVRAAAAQFNAGREAARNFNAGVGRNLGLGRNNLVNTARQFHDTYGNRAAFHFFRTYGYSLASYTAFYGTSVGYNEATYAGADYGGGGSPLTLSSAAPCQQTIVTYAAPAPVYYAPVAIYSIGAYAYNAGYYRGYGGYGGHHFGGFRGRR